MSRVLKMSLYIPSTASRSCLETILELVQSIFVIFQDNNKNASVCTATWEIRFGESFSECWWRGFFSVREKRAFDFFFFNNVNWQVSLTRADSNGGGSATSRGPRALGAKSIQKCLILWSWDKMRETGPGERISEIAGGAGPNRLGHASPSP